VQAFADSAGGAETAQTRVLYSRLSKAFALSWNSRNTRTTLIVALLLGSLVTAGLLTAQAYVAGWYQRAAAESVLRDYTSLVADEVIRRTSADVGYYGYYVLETAVLREAQRSAKLPADIADIKGAFASAQEPGLRNAARLAKSYFRIEPGKGGGLSFAGDAPPPRIAQWLQAQIAEMAASRRAGPFKKLTLVDQGSVHSFVVGSAQTPAGQEVFGGFETDMAALGAWMKTVLERQPLLPPTLGHGKVTNAMVQVSVRDPAGSQLVQLGAPVAGGLSATKAFGDTYQGIFSGYTVIAALDPQVGDAVIIGGLPRSRLPFFLGLLALNVALIVAAILQLRRETALQRLRDEFVASVSHELRTPLTQIRMFTETLLLERVRSDQEHRRSLEIIDREARRLGQLVENILQFSRSDRKVSSLVRTRRELAPLLAEIADDFAASLNGSPVQIEPRLAEGIAAEVDADAIRQIVLNLLDNGVKYGPNQQRILLGLEARDGKAVVFVEDEGPGIPVAERRRVFERFYRLKRDRESATAGTGIGLSVVRDLVLRHDGRCHVENGSGKGARFVVELPLAPSTPAAEGAR
jgi:signal transduction histidine kinase